jgi:hypothetical protein
MRPRPGNPTRQNCATFWTQFLSLHYGRRRATIGRDFPNSLYFLNATLSGQLTGAGGSPVETFLKNPGAEEVDVDVTNVSFTELKTPPFRAAVDFAPRYTEPNTNQVRRTDTARADVDFILLPRVPNDFIPVNPLGLQITHIDVAQAFR